MTTPLPPRPAGAQLRARRSPRLIALGVLLAVIGALGAVAIYQASTTTVSVLAAARTISRGEAIGANDLVVVDVASTAGLRYVAAEALSEVTGQVALLDIPVGALVTPGAYGTPAVEDGTVQIGLRLAPGRLPVRDMPAGTRVRLIGVQTKDTTGTTAAGEVIGTAVVVTAPREAPDGATYVLDVSIRTDQAAIVAQLAAADRIVVVRES